MPSQHHPIDRCEYWLRDMDGNWCSLQRPRPLAVHNDLTSTSYSLRRVNLPARVMLQASAVYEPAFNEIIRHDKTLDTLQLMSELATLQVTPPVLGMVKYADATHTRFIGVISTDASKPFNISWE